MPPSPYRWFDVRFTKEGGEKIVPVQVRVDGPDPEERAVRLASHDALRLHGPGWEPAGVVGKPEGEPEPCG